MSIHLLVLALAGTLALGLYHGYLGGLIRSAFKLLGLAAGILLARPLAAYLQPHFAEQMNFTGAWPLLVLLSFVLITVLFALAGWLVSLLIRWSPLAWVDKLAGAGLGFVMGLLLCAVILGLLEHLQVLEPIVAESTGWERQFLSWIQAVAPDLFEEVRGLITRESLPGGSV